MPVGISVIICCYNSALRIAPTLEHLIAQKKIDLSEWEVIVVDNGSTDYTAEKSTTIWSGFDTKKPNFKVVVELTQGLSSARKKGIDESYYDYVLFCDDDNWLDENYLHLGLNSMKSNSKIGALGGTGYPVFENEEPPYFWANQYHALAVGIQSDIEGDITDGRGVLYGAGMILNKTAFNILEGKYRFKFQLSDRTGTNLVSSGDHELCLALKKIGFRIYYLKKLTFNHFITRQRTTISYYKKLFLAFGIAYAMLHVYRVKVHTLKNWNNDYRYLCLRAFKNMLIVWIRLLLNGYYFKPEKYKHIDQLHKLYANIGILKTFLKVKNTYQQQFRDNPIFNIETYNKKD